MFYDYMKIIYFRRNVWKKKKKRKKKDFSLKWYSRDISKQKEEEIEEIDEYRDYEKRYFARLTIRDLARMKRDRNP